MSGVKLLTFTPSLLFSGHSGLLLKECGNGGWDRRKMNRELGVFLTEIANDFRVDVCASSAMNG